MERSYRFFKGFIFLVLVFVLFNIKPLSAGSVSVKGMVICERVANAGGRFSFFNIKDKLYFNEDSFPVTAQFESPIIIVAKGK